MLGTAFCDILVNISSALVPGILSATSRSEPRRREYRNSNCKQRWTKLCKTLKNVFLI